MKTISEKRLVIKCTECGYASDYGMSFLRASTLGSVWQINSLKKVEEDQENIIYTGHCVNHQV